MWLPAGVAGKIRLSALGVYVPNIALTMFDLLGGEGGFPRFVESPTFLDRRGGEWKLRDRWNVASEGELYEAALGVRDLLTPAPLAETLESGRIGLATLTTDEAGAILEAAEDLRETGELDEWWELAPLSDGGFLFLPNDSEAIPTLQLLSAARRGRWAFQLLRVVTGWALSEGGDPMRETARVSTGPCETLLKRKDPEAPYAGSCRSAGCPHDCTPLVRFQTSTGSYVLTGCACR
nr:hypothetical protein [uncultured bacterium]